VHGDDGIDPPDEASQDGVAALGSRGAQAAILDRRGSRHARRDGRASVVVATTGVRGGGDGGASAALASVLPGLLSEVMAPLQSKIDALGAELRASNERMDSLLLGPPHDVAAQANARHSPLHRMLSENGAFRQVFFIEKIIRTRLTLIDTDMFAEVSRVCRDVVTEAIPVTPITFLRNRDSRRMIGARRTTAMHGLFQVLNEYRKVDLFEYPGRLKWALERKFPLVPNEDDSVLMARHGFVDTLEWARQKSLIKHTPKTFRGAAQGGHLGMLTRLKSCGCPWDESAFEAAAEGGHLHVLEQLYIWNDRKIANEQACVAAASRGHLGILKWLRERRCPWDKWTPLEAARYGHLETLQYVLDCPGDDALNVVWSNQVVLGDLVVECFHYALRNGFFEVLRWIAERYDLPDLMEHSGYDFSLDTAVKLAIQLAFLEVVQWMVSELGATLPARACALADFGWVDQVDEEDRPDSDLAMRWLHGKPNGKPKHCDHSHLGLTLWLIKKGCGCPGGCPARGPDAHGPGSWDCDDAVIAHAHMWATARAVARGDKEWEWTADDFDDSHETLERMGNEMPEDKDLDAKFEACYASLSR
jgi:hypothetical protein